MLDPLDARTIAGLVVFLAVIALVIARPRGLNEAWPAAAGAAALFVLGFLRPVDLLTVGRETGGVLLFLLGMMVVSGVLDLAGVFAWAAAYAVHASGASGRRLLVNVFVLGAVVTALLSLDVTVVILTPVVYATVTALQVDPLPYLYACAFVANTGSLVFPMSNLTNLLVVDRLNLPFWPFAWTMAIPNAVAVAANIALFLWLFRDRLPKTLVKPAALDVTGFQRPFFRRSLVVLGLVLAGLFLSGLGARPLWPVALAGALVLMCVARAAGTAVVGTVMREVPWSLFPFVWGMAAIVRGVEHAGLTTELARFVLGRSGGHVGDLVAAGGVSALGANLFNNIPMTLVMLGVLASGTHPQIGGLVAATLIGVNIGPALTTVGSLATILWLAIVRRRGIDVPVLQYLRIGAVTVPLVLAAALAALALERFAR